MRVIFYLKGNLQVKWTPVPEQQFNFLLLVKAIRSDGHFLSNELYIQASEIAAIQLDTGKEEPEAVEVTSRRVERVN